MGTGRGTGRLFREYCLEEHVADRQDAHQPIPWLTIDLSSLVLFVGGPLSVSLPSQRTVRSSFFIPSSPCLRISNVLSVERPIPGRIYRMSVKNAGGHYSRVT